MSSYLEKANSYLQLSSQFRLGELPTEGQHPKTRRLSYLASQDLPAALTLLEEVDLNMLRVLRDHAAEVVQLGGVIRETFARGKRVYFCGCGSTGRLSLTIEVLWREAMPAQADQVRAFMAGGDVALIRSIENFEDHPEFGERQLEDAGFCDGDLLIASTEGGETPWVIGATLHAAKISSNPPFYLYCNPDAFLVEKLDRCRAVLTHPQVKRICLFVGPMAISGSTRMQASTVLQLCVGLGLFGSQDEAFDEQWVRGWIDVIQERLTQFDAGFLADFVAEEARIYQDKGFVTYRTSRYGITLMTDTTERSPTFSLSAFENQNLPADPASLCYLCLPDAVQPLQAWELLLHRHPRPLNWPEYDLIAGERTLLGFDFSARLPEWRARRVPEASLFEFSVEREGDEMVFRLGALEKRLDVSGLTLLQEHSLLKMLINMHSTLVMGRLGRYLGNVMTWVRPSNYKLIDRSIRYIQMLLEQEDLSGFSYEDIARSCFSEMETLGVNEPIVIKTFEVLKRRRGSAQAGVSPAARDCVTIPAALR